VITAAAFDVINTPVARELRPPREFSFDLATRRHGRIIRKEEIARFLVVTAGNPHQFGCAFIPMPQILRCRKATLP